MYQAMTSKKIIAVTGTRADYGLLSKTLHAINESKTLSLCLCVTGTHLSKSFGETKRFIDEDGISVDHEINIIENKFYGDLNQIFKTGKIAFFQLRLKKVCEKKIFSIGKRVIIVCKKYGSIVNYFL